MSGRRTAPADEGRGRGDQGDAGSVLTLPGETDALRHRLARRAFWRELGHRRRTARELDRLLAALYPDPHPQRQPSTYSLSDVELRAHANDLHGGGWPVAEVQQVLTVTAKVSAR